MSAYMIAPVVIPVFELTGFSVGSSVIVDWIAAS
jgi:hypothetical protein